MFVQEFPTFDLGKYILREHSDEDYKAFFDYYADERVNKYILTEIPKTLEEARQDLHYWRNIFYTNNGIYFTIADKETNLMVGTAGLGSYNRYNSRIEISYDVDHRHWRRGIASTVVLALIKYTFDTLSINRVEAITSIYNKASICLLEKCGFNYEGKLRQHRFHLGKYVDVYSFSVLRDEYLNNPILHYPTIPLTK
jgi:[ribosomal protein S5]-alanine N-acetyltransferase